MGPQEEVGSRTNQTAQASIGTIKLTSGLKQLSNTGHDALKPILAQLSPVGANNFSLR